MHYKLIITISVLLLSCSNNNSKKVVAKTADFKPFKYVEETRSVMIGVCIVNNSESVYQINCRNGFTKDDGKYTSQFLLKNKHDGKYIEAEAMALLENESVAPGISYCFYILAVDENISKNLRENKGENSLHMFKNYYELCFANQKDTLSFE